MGCEGYGEGRENRREEHGKVKRQRKSRKLRILETNGREGNDEANEDFQTMI